MNIIQKIRNYDNVVRALDEARERSLHWHKQCDEMQRNFVAKLAEEHYSVLQMEEAYKTLDDSIVTISAEAPADGKRMNYAVMKMQNELVKYVRVAGGRIYLNVQKP